MSMTTSYSCQHDIQRKVTGHKQGPHRSPSAADESRQRRREHRIQQVGGAQRLHLATRLLLQMPVRQNASLFTSCCGEQEAQTLQSFAKETMATDKVALSQPCPLGFLPANRALEESQNRVCFLIPRSILIN